MLSRFFFPQKTFTSQPLQCAPGSKTQNENYFLCIFIPPEYWPSVPVSSHHCRLAQRDVSAEKEQQLQGTAVSCTVISVLSPDSLAPGVGAASSARLMHSWCYNFLKDSVLLNGLLWKGTELCGKYGVFSISFSFSSSTSSTPTPQCRD